MSQGPLQPQDEAPGCCSQLPLPGLEDEPPKWSLADPVSDTAHRGCPWPCRADDTGLFSSHGAGEGLQSELGLSHVPLQHLLSASWLRPPQSASRFFMSGLGRLCAKTPKDV